MSIKPMRSRQVQWVVASSQAIIAGLLLIGELSGITTMSPSVYGNLAYQVEAETWAWAFMITSMIYMLGIHINGRWKWSPSLRLVAAAGLFMMNMFLGVSAFIGQIVDPNFYGSFVCYYALIHFCRLYLHFMKLNYDDVMRHRRYARNS